MEQNGNPLERANAYAKARDVHETDFLSYLEKEFIPSIPKEIEADREILIRHIQDFYRSKGTEKSYQFLFRVLYDEVIEFYYPGRDILIPDHGKWIQDRTIRIQAISGDPDQMVNRIIRGQTSNATAMVERVIRLQAGIYDVFELFLTSRKGSFLPGETVSDGENTGKTYHVISKVSLSGMSPRAFRINDSLQFVGGSGAGAKAEIAKVDETGEITSIRVIDPGAGYDKKPTLTYVPNETQRKIYTFAKIDKDEPAYLKIAYADQSEDLADIDGNFWISGWFIFEDVTKDCVLFSKADSETDLTFAVYFDGDWKAAISDGSTTKTVTYQKSSWESGVPYFVLLEWTNGNFSLSINNEETFTETHDLNPDTSHDLYIGHWPEFTTEQNIKINQVAFGRTPISERDKRILFNGGSGNSYENFPNSLKNKIVSFWQLDEASGDRFDAKGENDLSDVGGVESVLSANPLSASIETSAMMEYPGHWLNEDGHLDTEKFLRDDRYYQEYSYVIFSSQILAAYQNLVKDLVHPAGTILFGGLQISATEEVQFETDVVVEKEIHVNPLAMEIDLLPDVPTDLDRAITFPLKGSFSILPPTVKEGKGVTITPTPTESEVELLQPDVYTGVGFLRSKLTPLSAIAKVDSLTARNSANTRFFSRHPNRFQISSEMRDLAHFDTGGIFVRAKIDHTSATTLQAIVSKWVPATERGYLLAHTPVSGTENTLLQFFFSDNGSNSYKISAQVPCNEWLDIHAKVWVDGLNTHVEIMVFNDVGELSGATIIIPGFGALNKNNVDFIVADDYANRQFRGQIEYLAIWRNGEGVFNNDDAYDMARSIRNKKDRITVDDFTVNDISVTLWDMKDGYDLATYSSGKMLGTEIPAKGSFSDDLTLRTNIGSSGWFDSEGGKIQILPPTVSAKINFDASKYGTVYGSTSFEEPSHKGSNYLLDPSGIAVDPGDAIRTVKNTQNSSHSFLTGGGTGKDPLYISGGGAKTEQSNGDQYFLINGTGGTHDILDSRTAITLCWVFEPTYQRTGRLFQIGEAGHDQTVIEVSYTYDGANSRWLVGASCTDVAGIFLGSAGSSVLTSQSQLNMFMVQIDYSTAEFSFYRNGSLVAWNPGLTTGGTNTGPLSVAAIFADGNLTGTSNKLYGNLYEFHVWTQILTSTDRDRVFELLMEKHGIS